MSAKLGDILIQQGVIDEEKLIAALSDQRAFGGKLGRTLVDLGYVSEDQLMNALAEQLGLDRVELDHSEIPDDALSALPVDACERYGVFPVRVDKKEGVLWVATAEPDRQTLQDVAGGAAVSHSAGLGAVRALRPAGPPGYFCARQGGGEAAGGGALW